MLNTAELFILSASLNIPKTKCSARVKTGSVTKVNRNNVSRVRSFKEHA